MNFWNGPTAADPKLVEQVLDLACDLQQVPSPTFAEARRSAWFLERLKAEGLAQPHIDPAGNALACLPGTDPGRRPVVVSAHLDTVFPLEADLTLSRTRTHIAGAGIGDNSLGVAGLLGLVWMLRARGTRLPGDVWLAANVGEEGLGDLKGMRGLVERFGADPLAYLILEGIGLGEIYHRGLPIQRYRIEIRTPGGHSWSDYGRASAIHELAVLVNRLVELPIPREPRTSLNVGVIHGGTTVNTLAAYAWAEIDLRSVSVETVKELSEQVCQLAYKANRGDVECLIEMIGQRPAGEIPVNHPLVRLAARCLKGLDLTAHTGIGSTDANAPLSLGYPAICLGLTTGGGAHTQEEFIRIAPLGQGLEQIYRIVTRAWDEL
jgi:acetylornithine deacetylase/succinyl-diaminopimelate desuccinylase-like protein